MQKSIPERRWVQGASWGCASNKKGADAPFLVEPIIGSGILYDVLVRPTKRLPIFEIGIVSALAVLIGAAALIGTCTGHPDVLARRDVTRLRVRRHIEPTGSRQGEGIDQGGGGAAVGIRDATHIGYELGAHVSVDDAFEDTRFVEQGVFVVFLCFFAFVVVLAFHHARRVAGGVAGDGLIGVEWFLSGEQLG